jgi:hypothetical protein
LGPSSQTENALDPRTVLEAQLRDCFGRVVYSHKTHEKCAELLLSRLATIKLWQIILSAVTTGGFVASALGSGRLGALIGIVVSTVLLILNAYAKNYDLGELGQKHRQAAAELWLVREKYLSLLTDLRAGTGSLGELQARRDALLEELQKVYSGAPGTTFSAYRKAQAALQRQEEMTFKDDEIDAFLPLALRRTA